MIISKLKDIKNEGVNVCFIQGNRQVSNKNVKSKTTSIKEYGMLKAQKLLKTVAH